MKKQADFELMDSLAPGSVGTNAIGTPSLSAFIRKKDEYDYKTGRYTTTENASKTPDTQTRELQTLLNRGGYTDRFGNTLKEDGLLGAKTLYAADQYLKTTSSAQSKEEKRSFDNNSAESPVYISRNTDQTGTALARQTGTISIPPGGQNAEFKAATDVFDYNTRLSYSQTYSKNVEILQNELAWLGYLDMSDGGWGYFGPKTQAAVNAYKNDKGLGNTGKDAGVVGKDTWSSLGLIYRTPEDIDAGVRIRTEGRKQYFDVSDTIDTTVRKAGLEFSKHQLNFAWFYNQVCNKGPWNIKRNPEIWENTLKISSNIFYSDKIYFFGHIVNREDIGNITYGYLGKAAGFPDAILFGGSIYNHIDNHGTKDWDNEYNDHNYIQLGIDWYNGKSIQKR